MIAIKKPNVELQNRLELVVVDEGLRLEMTSQRGLKRNEYFPSGMYYTFPTNWNVNEAAKILIDTLIADQDEIIKNANIFKIQLEELRNKY